MRFFVSYCPAEEGEYSSEWTCGCWTSLTCHIWTCMMQNLFELAFIYFISYLPPLYILKIEALLFGKAESMNVSLSLCLAIILGSTYHLNTN